MVTHPTRCTFSVAHAWARVYTVLMNDATNDRAYSIAGTSDANATGLTLEEAAGALRRSDDRYADTAHIRRDGRHVAFFSAWFDYERELRPMWQALPSERAKIRDCWF